MKRLMTKMGNHVGGYPSARMTISESTITVRSSSWRRGGHTVIGGVASVDEKGKGTFPSGVSTSSLSGVTSTALVPNLNADMVDGQHLTLAEVSFSVAPTFDANKASTFKITLAGQVTSSTLSGAIPGQLLHFIICQDGRGDHTFRWPSNVRGGMTVGTTASKCSVQSFVFDGTYAYAVSSGVTNDDGSAVKWG